MADLIRPVSPRHAMFAICASAQLILRRAQCADMFFRRAGRQGGVTGDQYLRGREAIGGFGALKSPCRGDIIVVCANTSETNGRLRRPSVAVRSGGAL